MSKEVETSSEEVSPRARRRFLFTKRNTDPYSRDFDPFLALKESSEKPERENVRVFDNIEVFESYMKRETNKNLKKETEETKTNGSSKSFSKLKKIQVEAANRDLSKIREMMKHRQIQDVNSGLKRKSHHKRARNVFTSMQELCVGPFDILYRAVTKKQLCRIYTRHMCGLRGGIIGFVTAFDRYMNLVLEDAHEVFCHAPLGKVQFHQKRLNVSMINEAFRKLNLDILKNKPSTSTDETPSTSKCQVVTPKVKKPIDCKDKLFPCLTKFRKGMPMLMYRRLCHTYARGDDIVLISLLE